MSARPKWLTELILNETSRSGDPRANNPPCDSWNVSGYWKGHPCGSTAVHRIGDELACGVHVAQSIARQKHLTGVEHPVRGI